jgi:hypothetical protein
MILVTAEKQTKMPAVFSKMLTVLSRCWTSTTQQFSLKVTANIGNTRDSLETVPFFPGSREPFPTRQVAVSSKVTGGFLGIKTGTVSNTSSRGFF